MNTDENGTGQAEALLNSGVASQDDFFEEPLAKGKPAASEETKSEQDQGTYKIEEAFALMGGFGRLQKVSYVSNTLAQGSAAFFIYCLVFLEKQPVYECLHPDSDEWQTCKREEFCHAGSKTLWRIDWNDDESIHNLIEQLDFFCVPDLMIGLIGALFLMGIVVGCSTLTRLGDVYGRKPIYLVGLALHLFFIIGILTTKSAGFAYFLLFVFGLSVTSKYYVGYTYNLEMQPRSHHVLVSTTMFLFESVVFVFMCIYFWVISDEWKALQAPNIILAAYGVVFLVFMPESPRFLVAAKRFDDARSVFKWIGMRNGLTQEEVERKMKDFKFDGEEKHFEHEFTRELSRKAKKGAASKIDRLEVPEKSLRSRVKQNRNIISQSFQEKMDLTRDGSAKKQQLTLMHSESFNLQGSFIGASASFGDGPPGESSKSGLRAQVRELWSDRRLKVNLIGSCAVWLLSSFNFYLITFYLKSFPGNVYVNSLCFACADMCAFLCSGLCLKYYTVSQALCFSYLTTLVAGILYLIMFSTELPWVIPVLVTFSRVGGSMSFNIGYVSVARLFPTQFVSCVFGIVNFVAHLITVGAPLVAEMPEPVPFVVFCLNAFMAVFASCWLVEIDRAAKVKKNVGKLKKSAEEKAANNQQE